MNHSRLNRRTNSALLLFFNLAPVRVIYAQSRYTIAAIRNHVVLLVLKGTSMNSLRSAGSALKHLALGFIAAILALTLSAKPSSADVTLFNDRDCFNAAAMNLKNIDFEGLIPAPSGFTYHPNGLTQKGVTFRSVGCDLYVTGAQYPDGYYQWNSGAVLTYQHQDTNILEVDLPDGTTAVGSDVMTILSTGDPVTVVLDTGETYNVPTSPEPNRAFMGWSPASRYTACASRPWLMA